MKANRIISCIALVFLSLIINAQDIDSRAYSHYTEQEINTMPPVKIEKMNFLFQRSFIIPDEYKDEIDPNDIDVLNYSVLRKEDVRVKVPLAIDKEIADGPYIYLLSYKELDAAYRIIDQKHSK